LAFETDALYGLHRSPQHWYIKIKSIFEKLGLRQNAYNPCLFCGHIVDSSDPADTPLSDPLTLGLYADNFVYFSADSEVLAKFQRLLKQHITINFMGTVEWFLSTHLQWSVTPDVVKVHLSQTRFASHLVEENNTHHRNIIPAATPFCSGLPTDACPKSDNDKDPQKHCSIHQMASTKHSSQPCTIAFVPLSVQQQALQESHDRGTLRAPLHSQQLTMASHSHPNSKRHSTHIGCSPSPQIQKHTTMPYLPSLATITVLQRILMLAGVTKLAMPFEKASCFPA
jgi:hypothetical protein